MVRIVFGLLSYTCHFIETMHVCDWLIKKLKPSHLYISVLLFWAIFNDDHSFSVEGLGGPIHLIVRDINGLKLFLQ